MLPLYILTGLALALSAFKSREKTLQGLRIAAVRFLRILPAFVLMLILVSVVLVLLPDQVIVRLFNSGSQGWSTLIAAAVGSLTLMPGFIAFPLAGVLRQAGVSFMVLSAFTTTLMMVGIFTFPIEREYFGARVTVIRNAISLAIALLVALVTGLVFGEVF